MRNTKLILTLLMALVVSSITSGSLYAQQPYSPCWHPDDVYEWTPTKDVDAKFNRSVIPLQPRFKDESIKANANQHYDGQVAACLTMHPSCSTTPSQGAACFTGYNPTYWQYMDLLVWWGGSAGEGIVVLPSAPVVDIAHLNGVKVIGQVFFPPGAFGGQTAWVRQMLTLEGGEYVYAKKLFDIAEYYGFDGWFINEESGGGTSGEWTNFFAQYHSYAQSKGVTHHEMQWYDCGTSMGSYQNMMKQPGSSYFLNYGSPSKGNISNQMSDFMGMGFSKEEAFKTLYFGVEQAQGGIGGNTSSFGNLFPADGHKGSLQIFNPEEPIWKELVKDIWNKPGLNEGSNAHAKMKQVFLNESSFWTNVAGDPSNVTGRTGQGGSNESVRGLANAIMERSSIQGKPFSTSFSAGLGKHRFVNGENKGTHDWYHRGMQDIMPTWRWWVEATKNTGGVTHNLKFELDWDNAYNYGTSIKVTGKLEKDVNYLNRLYKTHILIANGDKLEFVYKLGKGDDKNIEVCLGVAENANAFTKFPLTAATVSTKNGWKVATIDLSSLAGKTVSMIALNYTGLGSAVIGFNVNLGQLSILEGSYTPTQPLVTNVKIENELTETGGDIRLVWDLPSNMADVHHFNVYLEKEGTTQLVGQTRNEGFYIPKFVRTMTPLETDVKVHIKTVTKDMQEGSAVSLTQNFPTLTAPKGYIRPSTTLCQIGTEVTFEAVGSGFPTAYDWTTPAGATEVSKTANKVTYRFDNEGVYTIKVKVTNTIGNSDFEAVDLLEVSNEKTGKLSNVALHKKIDSASGSIPPEDPSNLLDGDRQPSSVRAKWCVGGSRKHWVIIDLKDFYTLYSFEWFDCGMKENADDNTKCYQIYTSLDKNTWTLVIDEKNRPETKKKDFIKPVTAQYIKFVPYDEEAPITIRIWEFEAYGFKAESVPGLVVVPKVTDKGIPVNSTLAVEVPYNLDVPESADFDVEVTSSEAELTVNNLVKDVANNKVTFDLIASATADFAEAEIAVKITNNAMVVGQNFKVKLVKAPKVTAIKALPALVEPGDKVKIIVEATELPTSYVLEFLPAGNETIISQNDNEFEVSFSATGKYTVTAKATNAIGTAELKVVDLVEVNTGIPVNVATGKTIDSFNKHAGNEHPKWIIDGKVPAYGMTDEKWCAVNSGWNWVIIDLEDEYELSKFVWYDGECVESWGNSDAYKIELSTDKTTWEMAVDATGKRADNIHTDVITPTVARYIKFSPKADSYNGGAIRVYEFEAYGKKVIPDPFELSVADVELNKDEVKTVSFTYTNAPASGNFTVTAVSSDDTNVKVNSTTINDVTEEVVFVLLAGTVGDAEETITVTYTNDDTNATKTFTYKAKVKDVQGINIPQFADQTATTSSGVLSYTVPFSFGDVAPGLNVIATATCDGSSVMQLSAPTVNRTTLEISLTLVAVAAGDTDVTVVLSNDGVKTSMTFKVSVTQVLVGGYEVLFVDGDRDVNVGDVLSDEMFIYDIKTDPKQSNFAVDITSNNADVTISNIRPTDVSATEGTIEYDITVGASAIGTATITAKLVNGDLSVEESYILTVLDGLTGDYVITVPAAKDIKVGETENMKSTFTFGSDTEQSNFKFEVTSDNADVTIENIVADATALEVTYDVVVGSTATGTATISVKMINGSKDVTETHQVTVKPLTGDYVITAPAAASIKVGVTENMKSTFTFGSDNEQDNFKFEVTSDNTDVTIENMVADATALEVTYDVVVAETASGAATISVKMINGDKDVTETHQVTVTPLVGDYTITVPATLDVKYNASENVVANYSLGSDVALSSFTVVAVSSDNAIVEVENESLNATASKLTFDIAAKGNVGQTANVTVTLTNGTETKTETIAVTIISGNTGSNYTIAAPANQDLAVGDSESLSATYTLGADMDIDADVTVASSTADVLVSNVVVNRANKKVTFDLQGGTTIGNSSVITLTLTNDGFNKVESFTVTLVTANTGNYSINNPGNQTMTAKEVKPMSVKYNLAGDTKDAGFKVEVTSSNSSVVTVQNVNFTAADVVTFDLVGADVQVQKAVITVKVVNGTFNEEESFEVTVGSIEAGVKAWPNPVYRGTPINVKSKGAKTIRIVNVNGYMVAEKAVQPGSEVTEFETSSLVPGLYLIKVKGGEFGGKPLRIIIR